MIGETFGVVRHHGVLEMPALLVVGDTGVSVDLMLVLQSSGFVVGSDFIVLPCILDWRSVAGVAVFARPP
jgi:hypothetical protein